MEAGLIPFHLPSRGENYCRPLIFVIIVCAEPFKVESTPPWEANRKPKMGQGHAVPPDLL